MKKLLVVLVLLMGVLSLNAQRTPVKISDLPKGVSDSINKEFPGYTIKETLKVVENNVTTYEVEISKGMNSKTLKFDSTGKSLKGSGLDKDMDKTKEKSNSLPNSSVPKSTPSPAPSSTPSSTPSSPTTTPPQK